MLLQLWMYLNSPANRFSPSKDIGLTLQLPCEYINRVSCDSKLEVTGEERGRVEETDRQRQET